MQKEPVASLSAPLEPRGGEQKPYFVEAVHCTGLGSHSPPVTNRGLQCTTELAAAIQYDYLQNAVHRDRTEGAEQIYMG